MNAKPNGSHSPSDNQLDLLLTQKEFDRGLRNVVRWVVNWLSEGDVKFFIPTMVLLCTGKPPPLSEIEGLGAPMGDLGNRSGVERHWMLILMLPEFDVDNRFDQLRYLGHKVGEKRIEVVACYFVSEAWHSEQPLDKDGNQRRPADDPNRKEIVVVSGMNLAQENNIGRVVVERDKNDAMHIKSVEPKVTGWSRANNPLGKSFFMGYASGYLWRQGDS